MSSPAQTTKNDSAVEAAGTAATAVATAAAADVAMPEVTPVEGTTESSEAVILTSSIKMATKGTEKTTGTTSAPPPKRQKTSGSSSSSTAAAPIFSSIRCIDRVPVEIWREHICHKFLNLTELKLCTTL